MCDWRTEWPHAERDYVHCSPAHAAVEQATQRLLHLLGMNPVVGWSSIGLAQGADEGPVFDAGDVARVGAGQEAVRAFLRVEPDERAGLDHLLAQAIVLRLRAVAPVDLVGLTQRNHLFDPSAQFCIGHIARYLHSYLQVVITA